MDIQLSVLIWTVINFCILMLLLSKLLFKPMLSFMDARREKIDAAKRAREAAAAQRAAAIATAQSEAQEAGKRAIAGAQAAYDDARREAALTVGAQEQKYERLAEQYDVQLQTEQRELQGSLDARLEELSAAFVRKLMS